MNNYEHIKQLSIEEMAQFLMSSSQFLIGMNSFDLDYIAFIKQYLEAEYEE